MRIVVKIGTQSLLTPDGVLDQDMIAALVAQIVALKRAGHAVVLVSSGAVGAGRALLGRLEKDEQCALDRVLEKQVLASMGQAQLIHSYNEALQPYGMAAAQLLMTRYDFHQRRHFVNVMRLLEELLQRSHIIPVINENDSLAVKELMFTDNDQLAALVAAQINADRLILLTNVDAVLDPETEAPIVELHAGGRWPVIGKAISAGGRGGMASKMDTARKMMRAGILTHIAKAREPDILPRLMAGEALGTKIVPSKRVSGKKRWLTVHTEEPRGSVVANMPLVEKLRDSNEIISILPVGLVEIIGSFERGDVVRILDEDHRKIGYGQALYDAETLSGYLAQQDKPPFIRYDDLYIEEQK